MTIHEPLAPELVDLDAQLAATAVAPPPSPAGPGRARRTGTALGWALLGFLAVGAVWQFGATKVPELPGPADTFTELRSLLASPFHDGGPNDKGVGLRMLASLQRVAIGFALATVVGVPLGMLIGAVRRLWQAANPVIQVLRPVSPLAWYPIWLVVFKESSAAAVWVIFITALWPMVINTAAAAASVPADQRDVARVFRFGRLAYVRHVLVPNSLPGAVTGMRLSMGTAWMVIVAVEMLSGGVGIGAFVWDSYNALDLAGMMSAVVLIGAVGVGLDAAFLRLSKVVALPNGAPS